MTDILPQDLSPVSPCRDVACWLVSSHHVCEPLGLTPTSPYIALPLPPPFAPLPPPFPPLPLLASSPLLSSSHSSHFPRAPHISCFPSPSPAPVVAAHSLLLGWLLIHCSWGGCSFTAPGVAAHSLLLWWLLIHFCSCGGCSFTAPAPVVAAHSLLLWWLLIHCSCGGCSFTAPAPVVAAHSLFLLLWWLLIHCSCSCGGGSFSLLVRSANEKCGHAIKMQISCLLQVYPKIHLCNI